MQPTPKSSDASPTLIRVAAQLLAHRRLLVWLPAGLLVLTIGVSLLLPLRFTSTLSMVPQVQDTGAGTGGLAAQLGITLRGLDLTQTPDFYAGFLRTRSFLRDLVDSRYVVRTPEGDTTRATLVEHYRIKSTPAAWAREDAADALRDNLRVDVDLKTGVITLSVTDEDPAVAQQIAMRALTLVNEYNNLKRQSQASVERAFLEERVKAAAAEMRKTEDELQAFMENNRGYGTSATLVFEHDRIGRRLSLQRDVFYTLSQKLDQSRVEQVRNTPLLTVLEQPVLAARPDRRYLAFKAVMAVLVALILACAIIFLPSVLSARAAEEPEAAAALRREMESARAELRRVFRRKDA